ncbi:MAG: ABC transporter permease [Alphaproteobacteria bacterium]
MTAAAPDDASETHLAISGVLPTLRRVVSRPSGAIGLGLTLFHVILAIIAPLISTHSPTIPNADTINLAPSAEYWMGTDSLGRDVFARVVHGGQLAMMVTACAAAIAVTWGGLAGTLLGVIGGRTDEIAMRFVDAMLSIPWLLFLLLMVSIIGGGAWIVVPILGFFYGVAVIRISRAAALQVSARDYVTAARARGESLWAIITREVFPNVADILLVEGAMQWSWMLLAFSSLSFLGFGATPPTPDWGLMIANERGLLAVAPWSVLWPCFALSTLIIGINLLADAIGKALGVDRAREKQA